MVSSWVSGVDTAWPGVSGAGSVSGPGEPVFILPADSRVELLLHGIAFVEKLLCRSLV